MISMPLVLYLRLLFMKISILTLFPEMFTGPFDESIISHAKKKGIIDIHIVNIRTFGIGRHNVIDDTPYGGGTGMVMRVDVLHKAIEATKEKTLQPHEELVIYMGAHGKKFDQRTAEDFSTLKHLLILCGHYEGIDERVKQYIDLEVSIGDFILTGGEIPAMAITDAVARLVPGVLKSDATKFESFALDDEQQVFLEHPHYTKPSSYQGHHVPEVLLQGNHKEIAKWRKEKGRELTSRLRPDLMR